MSFTYAMLAVAGWAWLLIAGLYLGLRLRAERRRARGFDVVIASDHEKQSGSVDSSRA